MSYYISYDRFIVMYEKSMTCDNVDEFINVYNDPTVSSLVLYQVFKVSKMQIKDFRHLKKMSQNEYAKYMGTSLATIARWESGKAKPVECTMRLLAYVTFLEIMNQ